MIKIAYTVSFGGGDVGNIFQMGDKIFLCGNGLAVQVPSHVYHERMQTWIENRMQPPLVFRADEDRTRCVMTANGSDVRVELFREEEKPQLQ